MPISWFVGRWKEGNVQVNSTSLFVQWKPRLPQSTFSLLPSATFHNAIILEDGFTRQLRRGISGMTSSNSPASCRLHPQVGEPLLLYLCCAPNLHRAVAGNERRGLPMDFGVYTTNKLRKDTANKDRCSVGSREYLMGEQLENVV